MGKEKGKGTGSGSEPEPRSVLVEQICIDGASKKGCTVQGFADQYTGAQLKSYAAPKLDGYTNEDVTNSLRRLKSKANKKNESSRGKAILKDGMMTSNCPSNQASYTDLRQWPNDNMNASVYHGQNGGNNVNAYTLNRTNPHFHLSQSNYPNSQYSGYQGSSPYDNINGSTNNFVTGPSAHSNPNHAPAASSNGRYFTGGQQQQFGMVNFDGTDAQYPNNRMMQSAHPPLPSHSSQGSNHTADLMQIFQANNDSAANERLERERIALERERIAAKREESAKRIEAKREESAKRIEANERLERERLAAERERIAANERSERERIAAKREESAKKIEANERLEKEKLSVEERGESQKAQNNNNSNNNLVSNDVIYSAIGDMGGKINDIHISTSTRKGPRSATAAFRRDEQSTSDNVDFMDTFCNDSNDHDSPNSARTMPQPNFDTPMNGGQVFDTTSNQDHLHRRFLSVNERTKKIINFNLSDKEVWQNAWEITEEELKDGVFSYPALDNAQTTSDATQMILDTLSADSMYSLGGKVLCLGGDMSSLAYFDMNEVNNDTEIYENLEFDVAMRALFLPHKWTILIDIKGRNDDSLKVELSLWAEKEDGGGALHGAILEGILSVSNIQSIHITSEKDQNIPMQWNINGENLSKAFSQEQIKRCKLSFTNIRFNGEQCRMLAMIVFIVSFKNCVFQDEGQWLVDGRLSIEAIEFKEMNAPINMMHKCTRFVEKLSQVRFARVQLKDDDINSLKQIYEDVDWSMEEGKLGDEMSSKKVLWFDHGLIERVKRIKDSFGDNKVLGRTLIPLVKTGKRQGEPCKKCKKALQSRGTFCSPAHGKNRK